MKSGVVESMLAELNEIDDTEGLIFASIGGLLLSSAILNNGLIAVISAVMVKTTEIAIWMFHVNITGESNMSTLIVAGAGPGAVLIYQKNRGNMGLRKERSRWEIIKDILAVTLEERAAKKTRIMQKACLDWRNFQRYFDFVLEEGFIEKCNPDTGHYMITEKGEELLKRLNEVEELLGQD